MILQSSATRKFKPGGWSEQATVCRNGEINGDCPYLNKWGQSPFILRGRTRNFPGKPAAALVPAATTYSAPAWAEMAAQSKSKSQHGFNRASFPHLSEELWFGRMPLSVAGTLLPEDAVEHRAIVIQIVVHHPAVPLAAAHE